MTERFALCLESDAETRRQIGRALRDWGYDVATPSDTSSALRLAQEHAIALAVLSMEIPDVDALDLFRRLRQTHPAAQGIFLTTRPEAGAVREADRSGVRQILVKPVSDSDFDLLLADECDSCL